MRRMWDIVYAAPSLPPPVALLATKFQQRRLRSALRRGGFTAHDVDVHDATIIAAAFDLLRESSSPGRAAVERGPSTLGGEGVFATRPIASGQLVAFFAGRSFFPVPDGVGEDGEDDEATPSWGGGHRGHEHASWAANDKVLVRNDGTRIDGDAFESDAAFAAVHRRYAIGQMCNHPAADQSPNVMGWPLDWEVEALEKRGVARDAIPNALHECWYYSTRSGAVPLPASAPVPGLAMVTTRRVAPGEELLFDYELPNFAARPEWFAPRNALRDAAAEDAERALEEEEEEEEEEASRALH